MCDCRQEIEAELTERFAQGSPSTKEHKVVLSGYGLALNTATNRMAYRPKMDYEARHTVTTKAGKENRKTSHGSMFFSFCPFCGVKVEE